LKSPFLNRGVDCGSMTATNQGACQSRKTAKNDGTTCPLAKNPNQELAPNPKLQLGTSPRAARRYRNYRTGVSVMLGKLAGAWLGEKVAGNNNGAKGAILGYGAAALARRSVPTLAAVAIGGWAWKKWRNRRRAPASYPSDTGPSSL
jgi:hypothetical protein